MTVGLGADAVTSLRFSAESGYYVWHWHRMGRKGQRLRVICRGAMNSALVEFDDGYRAIVSRNAIRKNPTPPFRAEDRGYDSPCWIWQQHVQHNGYGRLKTNGQMHQAHRFYYEQRHGPIPEGLQTDHLCRVRACVNPNHMELVTNAENGRRGRNAKLTADQAAEIKASDEPRSVLAARYGVSVTTISDIRYGWSWSDVGEARNDRRRGR